MKEAKENNRDVKIDALEEEEAGNKGDRDGEVQTHDNTGNGKRTDAEAFPGPLHHTAHKSKTRI